MGRIVLSGPSVCEASTGADVFAPGDFNKPKPPAVPLQDNRTIGMIVLLVSIILCLLLVLSLDSAVFVPFNATAAVTQTWQANHPQTATLPASPTPNDFDLHAANNP